MAKQGGIRLEKTRKAFDGFGDRGAVVRNGGGYRVIMGGLTVARVEERSLGRTYMQPASWDVFGPAGQRSVMGGFPTRKAAVEFVAKRVQTYGNVELPEWATYRPARRCA